MDMEKNPRAFRMDRIDRVASGLFAVLTWLSVIPVVFILLNTTANVISRAFFSHSIFGSVQLSTVVLSLVVMCAMPVVTMYNTHIKVDLLVEKFPQKVQDVLFCFNFIACAAIMVITSLYTFQKAAKTMAMGTCTDALSIPYWPIYDLIAIMLMLSAVCAIYNLIHFLVSGTTVNPMTFTELKARLKNEKEADGK